MLLKDNYKYSGHCVSCNRRWLFNFVGQPDDPYMCSMLIGKCCDLIVIDEYDYRHLFVDDDDPVELTELEPDW